MRAIGKTFTAVAILILFGATTALAGPPDKGRGHNKHHGKHAGKGAVVYTHEARRFQGGPPPWAPAHGYRRKMRQHDTAILLPTAPTSGAPLLGQCNREMIGQLLGGAAGAAVGSQIGDGKGRLAAIAAGTIIGVLVGGEVGRSMDRADALCMDEALENAPDGSTVIWASDRHEYEVTPQQTFQTADGSYCREYQANSSVGNDTVQTYGTACRQPDGSWQIVN